MHLHDVLVLAHKVNFLTSLCAGKFSSPAYTVLHLPCVSTLPPTQILPLRECSCFPRRSSLHRHLKSTYT